MLNNSSVDFCGYTFEIELVALQLIGPRSEGRFPTRTTKRSRCNCFSKSLSTFQINHKNYNFLDCDWFKKPFFPTNSLAKLLLDILLLDSLLSDSSVGQTHSKL